MSSAPRSSRSERRRDERTEQSDWPERLSNPARRALHSAGYTRLEQLTQAREAELQRLHGVGPKALDQLRMALRARGLSFAPNT
jgi:Helix-hairpin-helix domain